MPFSHHSHSGEYCHHAQDTLESIINTAIARGFRIYALTEHMPRDQQEDLYPEEVQLQRTTFDLYRTFTTFHGHARALQYQYADQIQLLVGFETEYIRPSSLEAVQNLRAQYSFDFFIGSVHHVHEVPIDFSREKYQEARALAGGSDQSLFEEYFDHQWEVIRELRPAVIGHFDLIRLFSDNPSRGVLDYGGGVAERVRRNLTAIASYGGLVELNSAALRKGWDTPYPGRDVCQMFLALGGRFTLSDDAHNCSQVGLNYRRTLDYCAEIGLSEVHYLERVAGGSVPEEVLDACVVRSVPLSRVFWTEEAG